MNPQGLQDCGGVGLEIMHDISVVTRILYIDEGGCTSGPSPHAPIPSLRCAGCDIRAEFYIKVLVVGAGSMAPPVGHGSYPFSGRVVFVDGW